MIRHLAVLGLVFASSTASAEPAKSDKSAVGRGWDAVRGRQPLNPPAFSMERFENAWRMWGMKEKPAEFERLFRERYGLHEAPYENGGRPLGMHDARSLLGKGIGTDCLVCHSGAVAGQTIIGLGNSTLDLQGMFEELISNPAELNTFPFPFSSLRGTIDPVSPLAFLMSMRHPDLTLRAPEKLDFAPELCSDPPAWWQLKKKKIRDWTGAVDARSTRIDMVNLLNPLNSGSFVKQQEQVYVDIHAFVMSVPSPKYPFAVNTEKAAKGEALFNEHCARCHGTYAEKWTYPDKVVPIDKLGTDPMLATSFSARNMAHYNSSWFAEEKGPDGKPYHVADTRGYQAPPLDGIWATAPYFHNSSVPTVYHVLNSKARPNVFTRSYRTGKEDYDADNLGLKFSVLDKSPGEKLPAREKRMIFDSSRRGQYNGGHTYGDELTDNQRFALIEYLKTL